MRRWLTACFGLLALAVIAAADDWPQFRGPNRDAISRETGLYREWPPEGPKVLWTTEVCQGFAAAAIHGGKVYFNDYGEEAGEWYVRCLSLADGKELWRFSDKKYIRVSHGITRTVPAVDGKYVFSFDPKSVFHCLDAETGTEIWRKAFVQEYQTRNPPWYNGQCPLIEPDRVIVAPGGEALMVAFDKASGHEVWRAPNPESWPMSHSSVMPAELGGVRQYVWCTLKGLVGVAADDGRILWTFPYKFNVAVAPSPLVIDHERVFMTSCYEAGSVMVRVRHASEAFTAGKVFSLTGDEWNSECQTPILYENHLFAVGRKQRGLFTCLDLDGKEVWTSRGEAFFGLGSYILADGMFYILEGDTGMLRLLEASTSGYKQLASAQLLRGPDVWTPLALSDGKLVIRDMTRMVCLEVGPSASAATKTADDN
jgi:outer membrane protein assembly factor BamB